MFQGDDLKCVPEINFYNVFEKASVDAPVTLSQAQKEKFNSIMKVIHSQPPEKPKIVEKRRKISEKIAKTPAKSSSIIKMQGKVYIGRRNFDIVEDFGAGGFWQFWKEAKEIAHRPIIIFLYTDLTETVLANTSENNSLILNALPSCSSIFKTRNVIEEKVLKRDFVKPVAIDGEEPLTKNLEINSGEDAENVKVKRINKVKVTFGQYRQNEDHISNFHWHNIPSRDSKKGSASRHQTCKYNDHQKKESENL
uniref:Uncharacterized protein n=1 Tax=Trichogramma kaykai TaxID=54128 RepID=A0ABD2XBE6_9HYME